MKRISFKLPYELAKSLADYSETAGLPKAKIIRNWISLSEPLQLIPNTFGKSKTVPYQFEVDDTLYQSILTRAQGYGINISTYLRLLISSKLTYSPHFVSNYITKPSTQYLNHLLNQGQYHIIDQLIDEDIEDMNSDKLYVYARSQIENCHFNKALSGLHTLQEKHDVNDSILYPLICEIDVQLRNFNKISKSPYYFDLMENNHSSYISSTLKGLINGLMGRTSMALDQLAQAEDSVTKINAPYYHQKMLTYSSFMSIRKKLDAKESSIVRKMGEISYSTASPSCLAMYRLARGRDNMFRNNFSQASRDFEESIKLSKLANYKVGLVEGYGSKAIIDCVNKDYPSALINITLAQKHEKEFRSNNSDGICECIKLFIISSQNYTKGIGLLNWMRQENRTSFRNPQKEYLYQSARLLNSDNSKTKSNAFVELRKLGHNSSYAQLGDAISKTVAKRTILPFSM